MNFIKLHTDELRLKGVDRPYSRLFSNPPGDFGSMVRTVYSFIIFRTLLQESIL